MAKKQKKYPPRDGASWQPGQQGQQYGQYGQYGGWGGDPAAGMYGADPAAAQAAMPGMQAGIQAGLNAAGLDAGLLQGMPAFLRNRSTEQFLLGALIGAAAAWVLSDEELRGKIVKSAIKLYAGVAGGVEEMKEQMADIRAEVEAERSGDA